MIYPAYRKLANENNFYCIHSENHFEEIMIIGHKYSILQFEAKIYPDKMRIQDMLNDPNVFLHSSPAEYQAIKEKCQEELVLV